MIKLRNATIGDARLAAWAMLTALDLPTNGMDRAAEVCADPGAMYSWANAIVACDGEEPVGAIISYPGDDYQSLRQYTWGKIWSGIDEQTIADSPCETFPGEYYLDTMAIRPEYRGHAIGKRLIEAAIERGRRQGYTKFSLIVDIKKPRLKAYYESIGFSQEGQILFFGHLYDRMALTEPN